MCNDDWIKQKIRELEPRIIEMRRHIHQYPELGLQEYETAKYVGDILASLNIKVQTGIASTGVVGVLHGVKPGKMVALRADMDALPITEKTGLPFASVNPGIMHACGHDAHTASLLGTAMILSELRHEFSGSVKFIFQPAEENPGGAKMMVEQGVLEGVDAIVGAHVRQQIPVGEVGIRSGAILACSDTFDISIVGRGAHGAFPHFGVDAVAVASHVVIALQTFVSREINPVKPVVVTVSSISGGQGGYNTIADEIKMKGTVRSFDAALRNSMPERMEEIIAGVTKTMRAGYEFSYHTGYPATVNDKKITAKVEKTLQRILGQSRIFHMPEPTMAAEDMSYFLEKVPGTFLFIGSGNSEKGIVTPSHCSTFNIDEGALAIMTEVMTFSAIDLLETKETGACASEIRREKQWG